MKLICAYDREKKVSANHQCDFCGKLLCKICGYHKNDKDYCNECWEKEEYKSSKIEIWDDDRGWTYSCGNCGYSVNKKNNECFECHLKFKNILRV